MHYDKSGWSVYFILSISTHRVPLVNENFPFLVFLL